MKEEFICIRCLFIEIKKFLDLIFNIVEKLDCDTRANIYIGITGILIAIVIFIAEIISDNKIEIYKKLMLEKTKILKNIRYMIITLACIWIGELIKPQDSRVIYFFVQLLIDIRIFVSMLQTFQTFSETIKLNTNKEYFDNQLKEFLYNKIEENISIKEKNKIKLEEQNKEFLEYINNSKVFKFEAYPFSLEDEYYNLESNKYGYIASYDYSILKQIEQNLKIQIKNTNNSDNLSESTSNNKPEIYICKRIGDKCGNGFPIVYYKNVKDEFINMINKAVIIDNQNYIDCDSEISKIIEDIFAIAYQNPSNLNDENILINFYEFICKNNYESIITTFFDKVYHRYGEINDIKENENFCRFLNTLMMSSFNYNRYEDFNRIGKYITGLYIKRMRIEGVDLKYIAYRYANDVFVLNSYSKKNKKDYKYYDIIMSNLLLIIKEYLKINDVESIIILFDNIYFEKNNYYIEKDFNDFDVVNFQFTIAIIYLVLYVYEEKEKNKEINSSYIENIVKLINKLEDKLFVLYDMWDIIQKFNKFSEKKSEILHIIDDIDLDSDSHKYINSFSLNPIDINEVLKCMIYMFGIQYNSEQLKKEQVNREEKYKYNQLLKLFKNQTFVKLEEKYNYDLKYKNSAVQLVSEALEIAEEKEKEYELTADMDTEKINKFKEIVISGSNKKSKIEELIYNIGKMRESEIKLKRTFGFAKLIPRNWFIKDKYNNIYINNIAEEFGEAFKRGIEKEIIDYIVNKSLICEDTLEDFVNRISNIDNYILIANRRVLHNLKYIYDKEYVNINGKRIYTIFTFKVENFIVINKQALPNVELCKFDDSYNPDNIIKNIYIEITDCANDKQLRERIIEKNEWLKEKGTIEEQDNYLKMMCDFRVFKSFKISESSVKDSYILKIV